MASALAWVPHTATIAAVKVTTPPKLDLSLDDPVWKTGSVFDKFYNFTTRQPAEIETVAYLLYDDQNLYLAVTARSVERRLSRAKPSTTWALRVTITSR